MASQNAKAVAQAVLETIGRGEKVNIGKIALAKGYSKATAKNPQQIKRAKGYRDEMAPFVNAMIAERDAAIKAMKVVRKGAKYRDLTDAIDKLTKNIQLLTGGRTGDETIIFNWE
jgi:hypothetical protein